MPEEEVARVKNASTLEETLRKLRLSRTGKKGFPQDRQYYVGRDDLSIWMQKGPRPYSSTADPFELLVKSCAECEHALDMHLPTDELEDAIVGGRAVPGRCGEPGCVCEGGLKAVSMED